MLTTHNYTHTKGSGSSYSEPLHGVIRTPEPGQLLATRNDSRKTLRCLLKAKGRTTCRHNDRHYSCLQKIAEITATRRQKTAQAVGTPRPGKAETTTVSGHTGRERQPRVGMPRLPMCVSHLTLSFCLKSHCATHKTQSQGLGGCVSGQTGGTDAPPHGSKGTEGRAPDGDTRSHCCQAHKEALISRRRSPVASGRWHPLRSSSDGGHFQLL